MSATPCTAEPRTSLLSSSTGLRSFWMAGFESGCQINRWGERIDMIAGTRHDVFASSDYRMIREFGFGAARDTVRWHLIDRGHRQLDFSSFLPSLRAAQAAGVQVIWSLHHYGTPDDLDIFSPEFITRFVRYAVSVARLIRENSSDVPYFTPINEISFFSWAATRQFMHPFALGRDLALKRQLVLATIEACHALRNVDPRCRFVFSDPIIHVCSLDPEDETSRLTAETLNESQFEAWDMIAGRTAPDLGGSPDLLDIIGMNCYPTNQWVHQGSPLQWHEDPRDARWRPLSQMTERVWKRYQRPLLMSETSTVGDGRPGWILEVAREMAAARKMGVPIEGICIFPVIDRYDWDDPSHWHNSGLWEVNWQDGSWARVLNVAYADALRYADRTLFPCGSGLAEQMLNSII